MAELNFNALEFESQQIPAPLPLLEADPFPADCGLTADQKSDLGKHSEWLGLMDTPAKVIAHWKLVAEHRAEREAMLAKLNKTKRTPEQRDARKQQLAEHDNVVNALRDVWRAKCAERNALLKKMDEEVRIAHKAFAEAKNSKGNPW